jgi:protein-disulfide isomerase
MKLATQSANLLLAFALSLTLLGCNSDPAANSAGSSAEPTAVKPDQTAESSEPTTPAAPSPEEEAAAKAEWEAQRKQIQGVLKSMDRDELIGSSSFKGPKDAEVVLLKFSDFQCPYCAIAAADMKTFTKGHPDDVLYVYKQFPLVSIHKEAMGAAKAAWAAGQQDQFWLYHDGLFAYQDKLGEAYYLELAEQVGLDIEKFNRDRNSPEAQAAIDQDVELAEALGIRGTPTFIMNDLPIPGGAPIAFFEEAVSRFKSGAPTE